MHAWRLGDVCVSFLGAVGCDGCVLTARSSRLAKTVAHYLKLLAKRRFVFCANSAALKFGNDDRNDGVLSLVPSARAAAMLALLPTLVVGHAVLTSPAPRSASGMQGTGTKLPPFADAALLANGGCGGSANGDPG
eukprot:4898484-Prymnesium_polylepis.1